MPRPRRMKSLGGSAFTGVSLEVGERGGVREPLEGGRGRDASSMREGGRGLDQHHGSLSYKPAISEYTFNALGE